jgi:hypothetical protein
MKSHWINWIFLILNISAFSQRQDSILVEDQYSLLMVEENAVELLSNNTININNPIQIKQLPKVIQEAIMAYKSEFGCVANLYELYRIEEITISKWDSIMPYLTCGPCWQKPKFIEQSIILTGKDVSFPLDTDIVVPKNNIRYKGKSENGFRWGFFRRILIKNGERNSRH